MHGKSLSLSFALLVFVLGPNLLGQQIVIDQDASPAQLDQLPLVFEPNRGQAAADVHFLSRGSAYTLFLGSDKAVLMLPPAAVGGGVGKIEGRPSIVTLALLGASRQAQLEGLDLLPGKSNYFTGKDPAKWMKRVPQYAKVSQKSIFSGIDLMYYGKDGHLEYDFVLSPGADPRALRFRVSGATKVDLGVTAIFRFRRRTELLNCRNQRSTRNSLAPGTWLRGASFYTKATKSASTSATMTVASHW